ncbi:glycosyltransferase family protein [Geomonas oryzae]|uniref:hypothetical protein n=1 Tax=Geomonas oryzae TaxID=2364273 RepID=UPI00100BA1BD|nr:hypothetical protein [Geomonas oryzae]
MKQKRFPNVLIISKSIINDRDSAGASLRNWFMQWPKENLAQLYSGVLFEGESFCGTNFQLGREERRFGSLFQLLKHSSLGASAQPMRAEVRSRRTGPFRRAVHSLGKTLVGSGLWELIFTPRVSTGLAGWIETFRPEVLFVQGCDISFMRLSLEISKRYDIPICFSIVDDWIEHLYETSLIAPLIQHVAKLNFSALIARSRLLYAIGDLMAEEYQRRYGIPFSVLMQCDDPSRYRMDEVRKENGAVNIVYSGSLALNRWKLFVTLAEAVRMLRSEGLRVEVTVYAPLVPVEAEPALRDLEVVRVLPALSDHEVPKALTGADILFLPESFDEDVRAYTRLSVSTKAHLYMMSRRPVLIVGPPEIGTVDYARRGGWGYVVDKDDSLRLAEAIRVLVSSPEISCELVRRGEEIASKNHSAPSIRERLLQELSDCAAYGGTGKRRYERQA